jgi:hypothetical protein
MNFKRIPPSPGGGLGPYCKFGLVISGKLAENIFFVEFTACDMLEGMQNHKRLSQ